MKLLTTWMCRAHCHRVIKLSGTIGKVSPEKELVENVHGVRGTFLDVGREVARRIQQQNISGVWTLVGTEPDPVFGAEASPTVYFLGKLMLSKGIFSLMELLKYAEETAGLRVKVDMYGSGADQATAEAKAEKLGLDLPFHGPLDHAELAYSHKVGQELTSCRARESRVLALSFCVADLCESVNL
jgi:digalactosyldiacylglycerol synthase